MASEFNLIAFQDKLIAVLVSCWGNPSWKARRAGKLHAGKVATTLRKAGYTHDQAYAIIRDAKDVAILQLETRCRPQPA